MKILVTGTTGGIGRAVKRAALAAGHEVVEMNRGGWEAVDSPLTSGKDSPRIAPATQLASLGGYASPLRGLDAVVFSTGTCPVKPFALTSDTLFEETFRVNCGLFVKLMRHIVAERLYSPTGMKVVAISSVSATEGWAGGAAYCASKGALSAVCRALDAELQPKKISVVALEPRYVKTKMFDACAGRMGVDPALAQSPDALAAEILTCLKA